MGKTHRFDHLQLISLFILFKLIMFFSKISSALILVASIFPAVDAIPQQQLQPLGQIGTKDCPSFKGTFTFTIKIEQEDIFTNNYSFDGTLFHLDGVQAGQISTGCQVSHFLSDITGEPSGPCVTEIVLIENNELLAVITGSGTSIFGFRDPGSMLTVTGGDACALGTIGSIDLISDKVVLTLS